MDPDEAIAKEDTESKAIIRKIDESSQISIHEFLNYLKTAYQVIYPGPSNILLLSIYLLFKINFQVQDNIEGILVSGGMSEAVRWLKKKRISNI